MYLKRIIRSNGSLKSLHELRFFKREILEHQSAQPLQTGLTSTMPILLTLQELERLTYS
jgi:hypothetical protein